MTRTGTLLGIAAACAGVYILFLSKGAVGGQCRLLEIPMQYYYLTYTGAAKPWEDALGECHSVIYKLEIFDSWYGEYLTPQELGITNLEKGMECRVMVIEPCNLCGFVPSSPVV